MHKSPIKLRSMGWILIGGLSIAIYVVVICAIPYVIVFIMKNLGGSPLIRLSPAAAFETIFAVKFTWIAVVTFVGSAIVAQLFGWGGATWLARRVYNCIRSKLLKSHKAWRRRLGLRLDHKIYRNRTTAFMSLADLDEVIREIYDRASGYISLFNPPRELFQPNSSEFKNVREALKGRREHIAYIEASLRPEVLADIDVNSVAVALGLDIENVRLKCIDDELLQFANHFRAAAYTIHKNGDEGRDAREIGYFLFRPIHPPFCDGYVFIQEKESLTLSAAPRDADQVAPQFPTVELRDQVNRFLRGELKSCS
jgi:hypothetical protein